MYAIVKKGLLIVLTTVFFWGCSRKNDTFLSRNAHAVTAEYNTLYNGGLALDQGKKALIGSFQDNFWEILPVERLEPIPDDQLEGQNNNPDFERAEEKAIKAIQKHSMEINGEERNPQIDEAFMMLGKARYFDQRFVRALEAFNYILAFYPTSNSIAQAKIWKEKTNIRLDNNEIAIDKLEKLLKGEKLTDKDIADAYAMIGQAYVNLNQKDSALVKINNAATYTHNNEERGRYLYIKGQLYDALQKADSANMAYDEVIALNRKSPRNYMINAYIAKAKNFDYQNGDKIAFFELLKDLEKDRENRPFLDRIYNQLGAYYLKEKEIDSAVAYYNRSLRTQSDDKYLKSRNYLVLGDLDFEAAAYQKAGAYYDSTLTHIDERSREYRRIKKRRENLEDVINYERIAKVNDSILTLVAMSESERTTFFEKHIATLKEAAKRDSVAQETLAITNNEFFNNKTENQSTSGPFYFYNTTALAQGKMQFQTRWGKRELEDNWRLSTKNSFAVNNTIASGEDGANKIDLHPEYEIDTYLSAIPTGTQQIDSLSTDRNFAYYQLGLIYKEKFKENELAANRLESLLQFEPEERLVLPSKYYLYQIYEALSDANKQEKYKTDILNNYGDTRYAAIIRNPDVALALAEGSPEALYQELYSKYENQAYPEVVDLAGVYIERFTGEPYVPKFELLRANAIARYKGFNEYVKALNYIALNYPNKVEGKKAEKTIAEVIPQIQDSTFVNDENKEHWKLYYSFDGAQEEEIHKAEEILNKNNDLFYSGLYKISLDFYDGKRKLILVHGFSSEGAALSFNERLSREKKNKWTYLPKTITSENYRIVQIHKNLKSYENRTIN